MVKYQVTINLSGSATHQEVFVTREEAIKFGRYIRDNRGRFVNHLDRYLTRLVFPRCQDQMISNSNPVSSIVEMREIRWV